MDRAGARKQDIISCSAKLFRERGYQNTSIVDIGKSVGVSSAALYYHFPSKEDILEQVMIHMLKVLCERMKCIFDSAIPIRERIRKALIVQVETMIEYADHYMTIVQETRMLSEEHFKVVNVWMQLFYDLWLKAMQEGVKEGVYKSDENLFFSLLLSQGAIREVVYWRFLLFGESIVKKTPEELIDIFLEYRRAGVDI